MTVIPANMTCAHFMSCAAILVRVSKLRFNRKYSDAPTLRSANTAFGLRPEADALMPRLVFLFLNCVVGFDCFSRDGGGCVASLGVLGRGGDGAGHIAGGEADSRDHSCE